MDHLYPNNFQLFSSCDFNTRFNDRCYSDWGKTNLLALVSLDGVYILKPQLENRRGPFQGQLIRNPDDKFTHKPNGLYWPFFETLIHNLNPKQYNEVYLTPALTTNVENLSIDLYPRRFRLAKWSPVIDVFPRQCLLAAVTVDHQLLIYASGHDIWQVIFDLSKLYDTIWMHLNPVNQDTKFIVDDYESIRKNILSLSFCAICWKESKDREPLLLAATISGDIVVFRTIVGPDKTSCPLKDTHIENPTQIGFDAPTILKTDLQNITSMQLVQGLLIISTRDGQLVLYDLTLNFQEIETLQDTAQCLTASKTLHLLAIPPTATLWLKDNIEVTDFYVQPIAEGTWRIVLAKSTNICWCIINYRNGSLDQPATLSISDSFSAIDGLDPEVSLHQTSATWMRRASGKRAVLLANDGSFFQLEFVDDQQDATPDLNAIRSDRVDLSRMVPRGLCTSPNGHLIAMISSLFLVYDPAKIKEPTRMLICPAVNDRSFFIDCLNNLLDTSWLDKNSIHSPMDVCDMIDSLRFVSGVLNQDQLVQLRSFLESAGLKLGFPKTHSEMVKLKIITYLLLKLVNAGSHNEPVVTGSGDLTHNYDCAKLADNILLFSIDQLLTDEFGLSLDSTRRCVEQASLMNENQIKSLRNIRTWLATNQEAIRHGVKSRWDRLYEALASKLAECPAELCLVCGLEINFASLDHATCPNSHRFNRCARSLLVASLASCDQIKCPDCQRHYLDRHVWPPTSAEGIWTCSFCQ